MQTALFSGSPEAFKVFLDDLIATVTSIQFIIVTHQKATYMVVYTP